MEEKSYLGLYRILDLSRWPRPDAAGKLLGDLGGDKIKVENPEIQAGAIGPFYQNIQEPKGAFIGFPSIQASGNHAGYHEAEGQGDLHATRKGVRLCVGVFPARFPGKLGMGYSDLC